MPLGQDPVLHDTMQRHINVLPFFFFFIVIRAFNTFLSVQYNIAKYRHNVIHQISRINSSRITEILYPLNSNSPLLTPSSPWQPSFYSRLLWSLLFQKPHIRRIIGFVCDWLTSLRITSSRFILTRPEVPNPINTIIRQNMLNEQSF